MVFYKSSLDIIDNFMKIYYILYYMYIVHMIITYFIIYNNI